MMMIVMYNRYWNYAGPLFMFSRSEARHKTDFGPHDVDYARAAKQFYFNGTLSPDKVDRFVNKGDIIDDDFTIDNFNDGAIN